MNTVVTSSVIRRCCQIHSRYSYRSLLPLQVKQSSYSSSSRSEDGNSSQQTQDGNDQKVPKDTQAELEPAKGGFKNENWKNFGDTDLLHHLNANMIPTWLERKILVWAGKYKNEAEIPLYVTPQSIRTSKDRIRVVLLFYFMLWIAIACLTVIKIRQKERRERFALHLKKDKEHFDAVFNNPDYISAGAKKR